MGKRRRTESTQCDKEISARFLAAHLGCNNVNMRRKETELLDYILKENSVSRHNGVKLKIEIKRL